MNSVTKEFLLIVLCIFAIFAVGIAMDSDGKTRCKYTAMEKHYSVDDIDKLCGK